MARIWTPELREQQRQKMKAMLDKRWHSTNIESTNSSIVDGNVVNDDTNIDIQSNEMVENKALSGNNGGVIIRQDWLKTQGIIGKYAIIICQNILKQMKDVNWMDIKQSNSGRNALTAYSILWDKLKVIAEGNGTNGGQVKVYQFFEVKPGEVIDIEPVNAL